MLALAGQVSLLGWVVPRHAAAAPSLAVLDRSAFGACVDSAGLSELVHAWDAHEPLATVSSTATDAYPKFPLGTQTETPESGTGSIEADDDLRDFDDFAYQLRVVFDGTLQLDREVERGASLGGRAFSRLEDNRSDKPPRG